MTEFIFIFIILIPRCLIDEMNALMMIATVWLFVVTITLNLKKVKQLCGFYLLSRVQLNHKTNWTYSTQLIYQQYNSNLIPPYVLQTQYPPTQYPIQLTTRI